VDEAGDFLKDIAKPISESGEYFFFSLKPPGF
jgi:hypothetical protein